MSLDALNTADLAFHPIRFPILDKLYQDLKASFWHHGEIDFSQDRNDWKTLPEPTKKFIKTILCLFAQLDGIVNENLFRNFQEKTSFIKEAGHFYAFQGGNEVVHNETYSVMLQTFIPDPIERAQALDAIRNFPEIRKIAEWAYQWMNEDRDLLEQLVAFVCIEGIIFQAPFAGIFHIKTLNKLPGLTTSNEWISKDEANHTNFGIELKEVLETEFAHKFPRLDESRVHDIVRSAVSVSENFTREAMQVDLVGLKVEDMVAYTKCVADTLLEYMGYSKIYNVSNPLEWMVLISLINKSNFFEKKVSEYARAEDGNIEWEQVFN